jgi:hypothetical protein
MGRLAVLFFIIMCATIFGCASAPRSKNEATGENLASMCGRWRSVDSLMQYEFRCLSHGDIEIYDLSERVPKLIGDGRRKDHLVVVILDVPEGSRLRRLWLELELEQDELVGTYRESDSTIRRRLRFIRTW